MSLHAFFLNFSPPPHFVLRLVVVLPFLLLGRAFFFFFPLSCYSCTCSSCCSSSSSSSSSSYYYYYYIVIIILVLSPRFSLLLAPFIFSARLLPVPALVVHALLSLFFFPLLVPLFVVLLDLILSTLALINTGDKKSLLTGKHDIRQSTPMPESQTYITHDGIYPSWRKWFRTKELPNLNFLNVSGRPGYRQTFWPLWSLAKGED